jgi:hypothetical protein
VHFRKKREVENLINYRYAFDFWSVVSHGAHPIARNQALAPTASIPNS